MLPDFGSLPGLDSILLKDEELLWAARPCRELSKNPVLRKLEVHVLIFGVLSLWIGVLFLGKGDGWGILWMTLVILLGIIGAGFGHWRVYYALTDHRVISGAGGHRTMNEIPLRQITGMTLTEREDGSGEIILAVHGKSSLEIGVLNEILEVARRFHQAIQRDLDTAKDLDTANLGLHVDPEAEMEIRRQMIPGESLLWADRPRRRIDEEQALSEREERWIRDESRASLLSNLISTVGCVLIPTGAPLLLLATGALPLADAAPILWIFAVVWFLTSSGFVIFMKRSLRSRISGSHHTFYGVTSWRAVFVLRKPGRRVAQSCLLRRVESIRQKPTRLGVGNIFFAAEDADVASDWSVYSPDGSGAPRFSLVADAEKVEELLLRRLKLLDRYPKRSGGKG